MWTEIRLVGAGARHGPAGAAVAAAIAVATALGGCESAPTAPAEADLVERGRRLFFEETFDGNGRTCGTCHPAEGGFSIDARGIAALPPDDPLFVFETTAALEQLENGRMLRDRGLVLANPKGFDRPHVFRSVPSIVNVAFTAPYGWSGEARTLRDFALVAVEQHFPRTLERRPGVDFRPPTEAELDALAAFMESVTSGHRREVLQSPTPAALGSLLATAEERRGMELFFESGKCAACHSGPALAFPDPEGPFAGRAPFFDNRGKGPDGENVLPVNREYDLPPDAGDGDGRFNTANLLGLGSGQVAFFHDHAVSGRLVDEIRAYTSDVFANSPPGRQLGGIELDEAEIHAIAAFLRGINDLGGREPLDVLRPPDVHVPSSRLR